MKTEIQIATHLKELFFGGNWTGVNLKNSIENITLTQANKKIGTLNTIAVLVFHINYYINGILPVLSGGTLDIKDKYSFDAPIFLTETEWRDFKKLTLKNGETLISEIEKLSEVQLSAPFFDKKYGSYYRNLHGIIEHTHYHLGQIVIIKKLLNEGF